MMRLCQLYTCLYYWCFFFVKQKTAYEMRISDWSSDVCSSDLRPLRLDFATGVEASGYVASEWLRVNEGDGVYGGIVFPSVSMIMYAVPSTELLDDILRALNGWIRDFADTDTARIKPIGMVNAEDPVDAARRVADPAQIGRPRGG